MLHQNQNQGMRTNYEKTIDYFLFYFSLALQINQSYLTKMTSGVNPQNCKAQISQFAITKDRSEVQLEPNFYKIRFMITFYLKKFDNYEEVKQFLCLLNTIQTEQEILKELETLQQLIKTKKCYRNEQIYCSCQCKSSCTKTALFCGNMFFCQYCLPGPCGRIVGGCLCIKISALTVILTTPIYFFYQLCCGQRDKKQLNQEVQSLKLILNTIHDQLRKTDEVINTK